MLVPIVLAAPALISGLSLWFDWGPQWPALAIVLAGATLALMLDYRRALRCGLVGAGAGLLTCPLLLLLGNPAWYLFVTWMTSAIVLPALLIPLLFAPPELAKAPYQSPPMTQVDAETAEQLAAIQRNQHNP
jgi:hypothetical protein